MLPVRSSKATPGVARRVDRSAACGRSAVIGDDEASRVWLVAPRRRFAERGAVGLVVNASRPRRAWHGCALWCLAYRSRPWSATTRLIAISRHYPALITATGIEQ